MELTRWPWNRVWKKKFQEAIKEYVKLHNWRKKSHYPMLRNVIRALYLVISWGRPSRWLLCCEDVACLLELANHYLLAYIAFLETTKIGFRIRHAASECVCVCVCVCICDFNFLTCWRIFINSLISFHSKTPYSSNIFFPSATTCPLRLRGLSISPPPAEAEL